MKNQDKRKSQYIDNIIYIITTILVLTAAVKEFDRSHSNIKDERFPSEDRVIMENPGSSKTVAYRKYKDGHFYVKISINNQEIIALIDTGATTTALTENDILKAKVDTRDAVEHKFLTANGMIKAKSLSVDSIKMNNFIIKDVEISIITGQDNQSLIGMSILSRFNIRIENDILYLTPKHIQSEIQKKTQ